MCNLYSMTKSQQAIRDLVKAMRDTTGNGRADVIQNWGGTFKSSEVAVRNGYLYSDATTSILRFIAHRYALPTLPGIATRDAALVSNGSKPMGDLTAALNIRQ